MTPNQSLAMPESLITMPDGLPVDDAVPAELRRQWRKAGHYRDMDVFSAFLSIADTHPLKVAVTEGGISLSYAQLRTRSLSLAARLHRLGLRAGDVLASNLPNGWRACAADLAAAALGAIILPYPVGRKRHETRAILRKSRAKILICQRLVGENDYAAMVESLRPELPALEHVLVDGAPFKHWTDLDQIWADDPFIPPSTPYDPDGPARLIVSSGSESEPKLVLYSHNALVGGQTAYFRTLVRDPAGMRALFCVPLSSPFGSLGTSCALASMGATLVNMARFEPTQVLRIVASQKVTHLFAGPNMVDMLLANPLLTGNNPPALDFSSLQMMISGGSALSRQTVQGVRQKLGCALVQSYGSADGVACHTEPDDDPDTTVRTVGRPDPGVICLRIVDEHGCEVPSDTEGEIWARGPMSPMCYYGDDAAELNKKFRTDDGWVRTGDRGKLDATGRLHLMGRRADTIVRNGIKVNLTSIGLLLREHPDVQDVLVVDVPDQLGEPVLHACVVPHAGQAAPSLDDINRFLLHTVGVERHKLVDAVVLLPRLPLAPSGKVDQAVLLARIKANAMPTASQASHAVSAQPIIDVLMGVERAGVLRAAIELGVFDYLDAGQSTAPALAAAGKTSERGMRILLDALAGIGLLEIDQSQSRYTLNELSRRFLLTTSPAYVGGLAKVYTADLMWETFRDFKDAVMTGHSVLPSGLETSNHPYWQEFSVGIANTSRATAKRLAELLQPWMTFYQPRHILDVACGNGIYGFSLAKHQPGARVCAMDWPSVQPHFERMAHELGVTQQVRFIGGDIFETDIPGQYDLVILSQILHHFDPSACRRLLARLKPHLQPGARVVIVDFMVSDAPPATEAIPRLFAAQMLGLTEGGDCYSVDFNRQLLAKQGFTDITTHRLKGLPVYCITADNP